jgi:hypothetical protein
MPETTVGNARTAVNCGIRLGQVYLSQEIIRNCGISKHTLESWILGGLRFKQPGTKQRFFLGDDLIAFIFQ